MNKRLGSKFSLFFRVESEWDSNQVLPNKERSRLKWIEQLWHLKYNSIRRIGSHLELVKKNGCSVELSSPSGVPPAFGGPGAAACRHVPAAQWAGGRASIHQASGLSTRINSTLANAAVLVSCVVWNVSRCLTPHPSPHPEMLVGVPGSSRCDPYQFWITTAESSGQRWSTTPCDRSETKPFLGGGGGESVWSLTGAPFIRSLSVFHGERLRFIFLEWRAFDRRWKARLRQKIPNKIQPGTGLKLRKKSFQ